MDGYCCVLIEGADLDKLQQESGGHRLQRVPPTEKRGRVHTSTVTVAIMDMDTPTQLRIDPCDVQVEWFSGTGKGGQHRNRHANSCRLTHISTGITVTSQTRSRTNSYKNAMEELTRRLLHECSHTQHQDRSQQRKQQVGSGMRGDKIRTIAFQNDVVTDHRTGKRCSAQDYLRGHMDRLW